MIVKMKKVMLLLRSNHREAALKSLRKLGVLHIQDVKTPVSEDIQTLETKLENLDKALLLLAEQDAAQAPVDKQNAENYVDEVLSLTQQKETLNRDLADLKELQNWYNKWSNISFESLQTLKQSGIHIRLYIADKNALKQIPDDKMIHVANEIQGTVYFALISESAEDRLEYKEEQVPPMESADVDKKVSQIEKEISNIEKSIKDLAQYKDTLQATKEDLLKRLELNRVKYGMGELENIAYLQGFCPEQAVDDLKKLSDKEGWGYLIDEPDEPEFVPTVLKNPKPFTMVQPLFDFMGTLPGYHEMDVSFVFLAFFTIFFAILVGDGGYGTIFLICAFLLERKVKNGPRDALNLLYLLSFATIIWGAITGNWFGAKIFLSIPMFNSMVIPQLNTYADVSTGVIMQLSFMIGVLHLCIAHLLAAYKNKNSMTAFGDVGWVVVLVGVFFVANDLILKSMGDVLIVPTALPNFAPTVLIIGAAIVLIFSNFQKNIIKGILMTVGNLPLAIIGAFGDIVSYVRLFAVGLASFIVAYNFNQIAVGEGINSIISGIIAAIILFLAHGLNIILCGMSVMVHGVRLNMLEFSGHVGVQWSGKPYKPFKE